MDNYYKTNKLKRLAYQKNYRLANKEIIKVKTKEKINCPYCDCIIRKCNISKHKESKKCKTRHLIKLNQPSLVLYF